MLRELGKIFLLILKKILQYKYLWFIVFLIIILISYGRVNLKSESKYKKSEKEFNLIIIDKKIKDNRYTITLKGKEKLITKVQSFPYDVGDIVYIKGDLEEIKNNTIPNLFNYQKYLQSRGIYWKLNINEIKLLNKNSNILNKIKGNIMSRIENNKYKEYLYAFILGDTSYFSDEVKNIYQLNGLSYILVIGSLQVMTVIRVLEKIEKKFRIKKRIKIIINILIIVLYILFTGFIISILRSGLCYILKTILDYKKIKIKYYNIILIVGIILLVINPFYLNNIGFLYSFSISLAISLLKKRIKGNYSRRLLTISFIAFIVSFPITIYSNYEVNFLSIIYSFIMIPIFNYIVFPLSILTFFIPHLSFIFNFVISVIEYLIKFFSKIELLTFIFRKPSIILIVIYFIIIGLSFYKKKYLFLLLFVLLIHNNFNLIIKEEIVAFLDVNEGDSIVIKSDNAVSLIDTGGSSYYEYSDEIIKYLKSLGVKRIDRLFLTHSDYDHMGEAINLVNNFKVEKIIFNCGEYNDLEKELVKVLNKKKIKYYSCIKKLNVDNIKFHFLNTKEYGNENDNSSVIYTEINGYKFLFMGDTGKSREKDILEKYNIKDIDVLKVGHHGSKTSSRKEFINAINPKYSIISVGKNNIYGHPNKEVLKNLEDSIIYRTDEDGSIMFKIKNNKLKIETCSP